MWLTKLFLMNLIQLGGGGQKSECDTEQLSCHLEGQTTNGHYFLISTWVTLVHPCSVEFW